MSIPAAILVFLLGALAYALVFGNLDVTIDVLVKPHEGDEQ